MEPSAPHSTVKTCWAEAQDLGDATVHATTMLGGRPTNEDVHGWRTHPRFTSISVFDGHGGDGVSTASGVFMDALARGMEEALRAGLPFIGAAAAASTRAAAYFESHAAANCDPHAGSCGIWAVIGRERDAEGAAPYLVGNVGDSRAFHMRGSGDGAGDVYTLSKDHNLKDPEERKRFLSVPGAYEAYGRANGILAITRAFGDGLCGPGIIAEPGFMRGTIIPGDILFLTCDGLFEVPMGNTPPTNHQVAQLIGTQVNRVRKVSPHSVPSTMAVALSLACQATALRSRDNMTALAFVPKVGVAADHPAVHGTVVAPCPADPEFRRRWMEDMRVHGARVSGSKISLPSGRTATMQVEPE